MRRDQMEQLKISMDKVRMWENEIMENLNIYERSQLIHLLVENNLLLVKTEHYIVKKHIDKL